MKMDELDAKREARRRRILDGAENRMKKILNLSTKAGINYQWIISDKSIKVIIITQITT